MIRRCASSVKSYFKVTGKYRFLYRTGMEGLGFNLPPGDISFTVKKFL